MTVERTNLSKKRPSADVASSILKLCLVYGKDTFKGMSKYIHGVYMPSIYTCQNSPLIMLSRRIICKIAKYLYLPDLENFTTALSEYYTIITTITMVE